MEFLRETDKALFLLLNGLHHPALDQLMWWVSYKYTWIPMYVLVIILVAARTPFKQTALVLISFALILLLSDQISVHLFKNCVQRYRPCHNQEIKHLVHLIGNCGGLYGFVSSHASNSFAFAILAGLVLQSFYGRKALYLLLLWATVVSYSRIYNGVHYPADVLAGAAVGTTIALGVYTALFFFQKKMRPR